MRRVYLFGAALLIIAAAVFLSNIANTQKKQKSEAAAQNVKLKKVRIATWLTSTSNISSWVGMEEGIFKKNGLDVTFVPVDNPNNALISGSVDAIVSGVSSTLPAAIAGTPIKWVATLGRNGTSVVITTKKDISQIKNIGVLQNTPTLTYFILKALQITGANTTGLNYIALGALTNQMQALATGTVDVISLPKSDFPTLQQKFASDPFTKDAYILYDFGANKQSILPQILLTTDKMIANDRPAVQSLVNSYYQIDQFIAQHTGEAAAVYAKWGKVDTGKAQGIADSYAKSYQGDYILKPDKAVAAAFIEVISPQVPKAKTYNLDNFIDYSFVK